MMFRSISLATLSLVIYYQTVTTVAEKKLPSYLNICKRFDPDVSNCWKKTFEELKPYLVRGIPEFKVPPIEPLSIKSLRLNQGNAETINFIADLSNLTISGGKDYEVIGVDANYKTMVIEVAMEFPQLIMKGNYKATGRVLLFQFDGAGKVEARFKGVTMNGTYYMETFDKKGKEYLRIKRSTQEIDVKDIYIYLHNLFRNNPEITKNINKAINDNTDVLYQDFKPLLGNTLGSLFGEYTNRAYAEYTFDQLLPIE